MGSGTDGDSHLSVPERGAALALLPIAASLNYYLLPEFVQAQTLVQFIPQLLAYGAMALWAAHNRPVWERLGLTWSGLPQGLAWGTAIGLLLGAVNSTLILVLVPFLGYDITFLKETPHAKIPIAVMVPWFILAIALFVELNFRGFLLGRLAALEASWWPSGPLRRLSPLALVISALTFAFDPFMLRTFRHLHWIAVWDGLVWGWLWLRTGNLSVTIVAHAVEVIVLYLAVRTALA